MWAAVYHGPGDLRIEEVPAPLANAGELLLRVEEASICGTDLRVYHGQHRLFPPGTVRIPGHEVVGVIAEIGSGVSGYAVGQRVFVAPNIGCGHCRQCVSGANNLCPDYQAVGLTMDGGFAQYMRVPAQALLQGNVMPVRADLDPAVAALIEPLACVLRGQRALGIRAGDFVLVLGAGPIGVMHVKLARLSGARRVLVSEPNPLRLELAQRAGADLVINPTEEDLAAAVAAETGGQGGGCHHRGDRRPCGARARPPAGCDRRQDQLLRGAAQGPAHDHLRRQPSPLSRADCHRNDGVQH
jgi:L-iditol 2-dehydrogenase